MKRNDESFSVVMVTLADGKQGEFNILRSCYSNSLALAEQVSAKSIAFPLISTGVYGFPRSEALDIALSEIGKFLLKHDMDVILVVFDKESFRIWRLLWYAMIRKCVTAINACLMRHIINDIDIG